MKIGKSVRMFIRERLAQRLRRGPLPEVLAAQTRAGLGPIAPFRADLPAFGGLFIRYDYRLGCATPSSVNLGDYIQSDAMEQAVRHVAEDCNWGVIRFRPWLRSELSWYDREPAICVMQGWFEDATLNFLGNRAVLPVWVGTHFSGAIRPYLEWLLTLDREAFRDQTFGCRDRSTLRWCREQRLPAYFSRCLTLTFPRRTKAPAPREGNGVFVVGPRAWRDAVLPALPRALRDGATIVDHWEGLAPSRCPADAQRDLASARALLARYRDEARLVVTSRIHCAQPCTAMGIPTVLINPGYDECDRFSTLDGILPIWTLRDLRDGRVDFSPAAPDIEPLKRDLLENLRLSILAARGEGVDADALGEIRARIADFHA